MKLKWKRKNETLVSVKDLPLQPRCSCCYWYNGKKSFCVAQMSKVALDAKPCLFFDDKEHE